ncbi:phosphoglycerate mutase-like protein [Xylariaceae sp. FL0016]|nr:phosphoglycerate mutase-like protein [Xylariaceae sp. FL0016]
MAPIVHLVRHAQGYHNLYTENQKLRDPDLTKLGEKQCEDLCRLFPSHNKITHLVASPIRRTLYTCLLSFKPAVEAGKKVIALPDAQEVSCHPCDTGLEPVVLKEEFGDKVDFHLVPDGWNDKTLGSKYYPTADNLTARARRTRIWLRELLQEADDDAEVVLVTHGGILHFLTEDFDGVILDHGTGWANTEHRSYKFADLTGQDSNATLVETRASHRQRRGSTVPLGETEQMQLRVAYEASLERELKKHALAVAEREAKSMAKAA